MSDKKNPKQTQSSKKEKTSLVKDEQVKDAFDQAAKDIEKDPGFRLDEDKDLDEGELAKKEGHP
jgi:hypothetical protein